VEQPRAGKGKVEVLASVISSDIVVQYEGALSSGRLSSRPGDHIVSIAALNLLAADGITLLVKLSGRVLSVLVLQENSVNLARCVEMEGGRLDDIESVLHPTIAYIEDELKGASEADLAGGVRTGDGAIGAALGEKNGASRCRLSARGSAWLKWATSGCSDIWSRVA